MNLPGIGETQKWQQIERMGKLLVFGKDVSGTYLAIYERDLSHPLARFETSVEEMQGLIYMWLRS